MSANHHKTKQTFKTMSSCPNVSFILMVVIPQLIVIDLFSGAPSGEKLLLRWTSYQASLRGKHSFYDRLVEKLQQRG